MMLETEPLSQNSSTFITQLIVNSAKRRHLKKTLKVSHNFNKIILIIQKIITLNISTDMYHIE